MKRAPLCIIRPATSTDAADLAAVHVAAWQKAYRGQLPNNLLDNLSAANREPLWRQATAAGSQSQVLICEVAEQCVGFASFGRSRDTDATTETAELYAIYLLSEVWGLGYGRQLLEACLKKLQHTQYTHLTLWVLNTNKRAFNFYATAGFEADGTTKSEQLGGYTLNEMRMRRPLP